MIQASFASREVFDLPAAIERHGGSGRTLFVGFILHDRWKYTEIIPSELLTAGDVGVTKYLNAMNVTLIVAHEPKWKKWFRKRSAQYPELERVGRFVLFGRAGYIGNYVMTGEAELLEAVDNRVTVRMGGDSAVIKFAYLPILVSDRCELRPFSISETLSLVEIARCNSGSQVTISMRSPTQRLARILHLPYGQ
jgi:hypothetical protein